MHCDNWWRVRGLGLGARARRGAEKGFVQPLGLLTSPDLARFAVLVEFDFSLRAASMVQPQSREV